MAWNLGAVGHFGLSVREPKRSAKWWIDNIGLEQQFVFDDVVAVGNDVVTIVLHRGVPHPGTMGHMSFHLNSLEELRDALVDLRARGVKLEDPGDEIGPEAPGSPHMALWFHDPDGYRWELSVQNAARAA
jgi:catechol 2,3-dioxygenase-like lactoylglutathione lyase family enzyme